jgi:hypothetical protein
MDNDYVTGAFILVGLCGVPLAIPVIFGTIILKNFWKDEISRLIGFLTLKSIIAFPIFLYFYGIVWNDWGLALPLASYIFFTLGIIYFFRDSLKLNVTVRFLLIGDFICWLVALVVLAFWNSIGITIFGAFLPTIYATLFLVYVYKRSGLLAKHKS